MDGLQKRPLDATESVWPILDPAAEYERTVWVAAPPFSIRKVSEDGTPQETRRPGTSGGAFAVWSSERPLPSPDRTSSSHETLAEGSGGPWEPCYPSVANPGGSPVGDLALWTASTSLEAARRISAKGQLRNPNLPRLPCLNGLDDSVACVFETAAGLGLRADILEAAIARYKAITNAE